LHPSQSLSIEGDSIIYTQEELEAMTVEQLRNIARERGMTGYSSLLKADLIAAILADQEGV
jgi:hypothetical protein